MKKIVLSIFVFACFAYSQEITVPVSLKKLTDASLMNYPKIKEIGGLVNLSGAKVDLARAGYLPLAKIDIGYFTLNPISKIDIPAGPTIKEFLTIPNDNYSVMLNVSQPLLDFKTPALVDKALSDLTVSNDNLESFKSQLAYQVAQIYFGIIYLNKSINVQQLQLNLIQANLNLIETKMKNGDALKYDLVSTQVRFTNVENLYTELQNQLNKQYNILNMLTGNSGTGYIPDTTISFSSFDITSDSVFTDAVKKNYDIITARDKIASSEWDITTAERSMLPVLSLQGSLGYKNGVLPDLNSILFNYYAGIGLTIPILSPSRPSIQKEMAVVTFENSKSALETQQLTLSKDILNTLDDIKKNLKKLSSIDTLLEQAQMALDLAVDRYKGGVITNLDLLTAQTNFQDAQLNKLQVEYNLALSKIELNRLTGRRWW
jgi:outer membrane protein TolC